MRGRSSGVDSTIFQMAFNGKKAESKLSLYNGTIQTIRYTYRSFTILLIRFSNIKRNMQLGSKVATCVSNSV